MITCEIDSNREDRCLAIANPNLPDIQSDHFLKELLGGLKIFDGEMMSWAENLEIVDK